MPKVLRTQKNLKETDQATLNANKVPGNIVHCVESLFHTYSHFFEINDVVPHDIFVHKQNVNPVPRDRRSKVVPYAKCQQW